MGVDVRETTEGSRVFAKKEETPLIPKRPDVSYVKPKPAEEDLGFGGDSKFEDPREESTIMLGTGKLMNTIAEEEKRRLAELDRQVAEESARRQAIALKRKRQGHAG